MKVYQPSINVVHDIGKEELFQSFIPNHKQLDIMNSVLNGVINTNEKSHLLIGPYGAGKSMVGALIASLLVKGKKSNAIKTFLEDVNMVNPSISNVFNDTIQSKKVRWYSVAITGRQGNFQEIILKNIEMQLKKYNVSIHYKHDAQKMIDTILTWKKDFPGTYQELESICIKENTSISNLIDQLNQLNNTTMIEFKRYYHTLTSGAEFVSENDTPLIEQISYILNQLENKKAALFIVFDEFGRFLQTIPKQYIYETMQAIQDLAELSNRTENLGLLFITHTGLQQYSKNNQSLTKSELERVEKRFIEHRLETDSSIFYRSAYKVLSDLQNKGQFISDAEMEILHQQVLKYNLFPDMEPDEREGSVLKGCQPIHPLTLRLLPSLSNILGQNDRTSYLFLSNVGNRNNGEWYYLDELFNYFYPDDSVLFTIDSLKYYRMALNYSVSSEAIRIVKVITLLNLLNNPFKPDKGFLSFALGLPVEYLESIISELEEKKLLRYNRFMGAYELYSGSVVEFEKLYDEIQQSTLITNERRLEIVGEIFGEVYYLPYAYNSHKSMTRFIKATFAWADSLFEDTIINHSDGNIVYVLLRNNESIESALDFIKKQTDNKTIYSLIMLNTEFLISNIDRYEILTQLQRNNQILMKDENLEVEIDIELQNVLFDMEGLLKRIKNFEKGTMQWFLNGKEIEIEFTSREVLEDYLSEWMIIRFPDTPVITNEVFNKRKIPAIQKKAAITLLENLLDEDFNGEFNIEGFGPDYLIKATIFDKLEYNMNQLDSLQNRELSIIRNRLITYLYENPKGKILDLYNILLNEPFGIREPIVPLLVVALLKDKWGQFAFYSKDFSISTINAEILYDILEENAQIFEYEIYELNEKDKEMLKRLNRVFFQSNAILQPISLFKKLTEWLRKLPKFTQITSNQSQDILTFKEIIRLSEIDALLALKKLFDLQSSGANLENIKSELEGFLEGQQERIVQETKKIIGITSDNIDEVREKCKDVINNSPDIAKIIEKWETDPNWLNYAIKQIVNIELKEWSDVTYDSYISTLIQKMDVKEQTESIKLMAGDKVITTINETDLSVKGRTVYTQLSRIVKAGGRTMNPDEVKYVLYKILQEVEQ